MSLAWRGAGRETGRAVLNFARLLHEIPHTWRLALMDLFSRLAVMMVLVVVFCGSAVRGQQSVPPPRATTVADAFAFRDLHDPQISPDGQWVAYTEGSVNRK